MQETVLIVGVVCVASGFGLFWLLDRLIQAPQRKQQTQLNEATQKQTLHNLVNQHQQEVHELDRRFTEEKAQLTTAHQDALSTLKESLLQEKQELELEKEALTVRLNEQQATHTAQQEALRETLHQEIQQFVTQQLNQSQEQLVKQGKTQQESQQQHFKTGLEALMQPLRDTLKRYEVQLKTMEQQQLERVSLLSSHVNDLQQSNKDLMSVLKTNKRVGDWGELQLLRILEISGLHEGINYEFQPSTDMQTRPDVKVWLPSKRFIYVDAKTLQFGTNLDEVHDEQHGQRLVSSLKTAIKDLNKRHYTAGQADTADFVVLFLPMEGMLAEALNTDVDLAEWALTHNVVLSGPHNLIALLKIIHHGWHQSALSQQVQQIHKLGQELHGQFVTFSDRLLKVKKQLDTVQGSFEDSLTAMNGRTGLVARARKLEELGCKSNKTLAKDYDGVESLSLSDTAHQPLLTS